MKTIGAHTVFRAFRNRTPEIEEAFAALYDVHAPRVYAYIRHILGAEHEAVDDVLQHCFIGLFDRARNGVEIHNVPAFLFRVARNQCLNELARSRRYVGDVEAIAGHDPEGVYETRELEEHVERAIVRLPGHIRESLVLKDQLGFTYEEIAEMTGLSIPNVRQRVSRARRMIRKLLAPLLLDQARKASL